MRGLPTIDSNLDNMFYLQLSTRFSLECAQGPLLRLRGSQCVVDLASRRHTPALVKQSGGFLAKAFDGFVKSFSNTHSGAFHLQAKYVIRSMHRHVLKQQRVASHAASMFLGGLMNSALHRSSRPPSGSSENIPDPIDLLHQSMVQCQLPERL